MTAPDYATAVEVLAFAIWMEVLLRVLPFSRVLGYVNRPRPHDRPITKDAHKRLPSFVAVAYELLPLPGTCLRQSLVLSAMFRRRGVPSRLCVGVARSAHLLEAHAWVEIHGVKPDACVDRYRELRAV